MSQDIKKAQNSAQLVTSQVTLSRKEIAENAKRGV